MSPITETNNMDSAEKRVPSADFQFAEFSRADMRQLFGLLKVANCPDTNCDQHGSIAVRINDDEWEQQQCQWCDERAKIVADETRFTGDVSEPQKSTGEQYKQ